MVVLGRVGKPRTMSRIDIADGLQLTWKSPQVRWRGWFPNDTDLLSPRDSTRLHRALGSRAGNDAAAQTQPARHRRILDDSLRKLRVPRDRGLAVTTTHLAPFGASLRDWAEFWKKQGRASPPPLRLADMALLEQFWGHHIRLAIRRRSR